MDHENGIKTILLFIDEGNQFLKYTVSLVRVSNLDNDGIRKEEVLKIWSRFCHTLSDFLNQKCEYVSI